MILAPTPPKLETLPQPPERFPRTAANKPKVTIERTLDVLPAKDVADIAAALDDWEASLVMLIQG